MNAAGGVRIRRYRDDDAPACAAVFASLPEWFGIPEAVAEYRASLAALPSFIAEHNDSLAGLYALAETTRDAGELHVIAVHRSQHRHGIGQALVEHAAAELRARGKRLMYVLTVSDGHPDIYYAKTRAFYERVGFLPLMQSDTLLNPGLPSLLLVRTL